MSRTGIVSLLEGLASGSVSRRDFIKRGTALGLSATAIASALAQTTSAAPAGVGRRATRHQIDASTLVIADSLSGGDWLTLDPGWFYEINSAAAMYLCYDTLYDIPDGSKPTEIRALLADGEPEFSEDGLVATIKLRQGVKFAGSGNEMKAADWIFSWNRLKNIGYQGSFLGADYWTAVEAVDDYTLKLSLAAPNAALKAILTALPLAVIDSATVAANGGTDAPEAKDTDTAKDFINANAVGTGPYMVTQWDRNGDIIFEVNPNYWDTANPAKLARIIFTNTNEATAQLQKVQTGESDMCYALSPDQVASVTEDANLQLVEGPTLAIQYVALKMSNLGLDPEPAEPRGGILHNQQVRQAIAYSIDFDGIRDGLLGGAADRPATAVPLPLTGTQEVLDLAYKLDIAKAQELWDASGVGTGEFELMYATDETAQGGVNLETLSTKLKSDIEKINGLTVNLAPMPGAERIDKFRAGDFQSTVSPWTPDYPDVDSYATPFAATGVAAAKRVGYSDPEVDEMLAAGLVELDPAKRTEIYVEIQKRMIDTAAFVVLYQPRDRRPASVKVQGVATHSVYQLQLRNANKTE